VSGKLKKYYKKTSQTIAFIFTIVFLLVFIFSFLGVVNMFEQKEESLFTYVVLMLIAVFSLLLTLNCSLRAAKSTSRFIMAFGIVISVSLGVLIILIIVLGFGKNNFRFFQ